MWKNDDKQDGEGEKVQQWDMGKTASRDTERKESQIEVKEIIEEGRRKIME